MKGKELFRLLTDYQKNKLGKKERSIVDYWYAAINRESDVNETGLSEDEIKDKIWHQIVAGKRARKERVIDRQKVWWQNGYFRLAAASMLLLLGVYFFSTRFTGKGAIQNLSSAEIDNLIRDSNTQSTARQIVLKDGSTVRLDPGSTLYYSKQLGSGSTRKVYLEGKAFFNVTKNPSKPFYVYVDEVVTRVVGTSFTVSKNERSGSVEVSVFSGKVVVGRVGKASLQKNSAVNEIVLTPNERVTFYEKENTFVPGLVDEPVIIKRDEEFIRPDAFKFEDITLGTVLTKIEQAYGVEIIASDESIKNCLISADLSDDNLYSKLDVISAAMNAKFEMKGNVILLTGTGCEYKP